MTIQVKRKKMKKKTNEAFERGIDIPIDLSTKKGSAAYIIK